MPRGGSPPTDVLLPAGVAPRLLWRDDPASESANSGEYPAARENSDSAYGPGWGRGESTHAGRPALCGRAVWPPSGRAPDTSGRVARDSPTAALRTKPTETHNHLERDFTATTSNTKWVTDITYIRTAEHWLYRCVVLALYSALVVGWSMRSRQDRQLVVQAVLLTLWQRPTRTPVILHSDRGCQFTAEEYQQFQAAHQVIGSMSAVGSGADNAAAESFLGRLKQERVNRRQDRTRVEARADIFDYIERWHNPRQRRRLEQQQQGEQLFTHLSVETG